MMATSPNKVFVGSYASSNPPSADFANTQDVIAHAYNIMESKKYPVT